MNLLTKYIMGCMLLDKAGEGQGGGGGAGEIKPGEGQGEKKETGGGSVTLSKEQFDQLMAKLNGGGAPNPKPDETSLADKVKGDREAAEKQSKSEKSLESALKFNISGKEFLKNNASLLPKSVESLFDRAEKETYASAIDKANDIKASIVSEFFAVQANHDLLTESQKNELDTFLKLTKNGRLERVDSVYAMIFEPTLETLRKIEKAKQVNGGKDQTDSEKALADRMMKLSKKHYLGEKDA